MGLATERSTTSPSADHQYAMNQLFHLGKLGVIKYAVNGAITPQTGTHYLTKAGVAVMTLLAPTEDGLEVTVVAGTANAHTLTPTGGINDGTTGGAKTAWTSAAFVGSSITLISAGGLWHIKAKNLGTVA